MTLSLGRPTIALGAAAIPPTSGIRSDTTAFTFSALPVCFPQDQILARHCNSASLWTNSSGSRMYVMSATQI